MCVPFLHRAWILIQVSHFSNRQRGLAKLCPMKLFTGIPGNTDWSPVSTCAKPGWTVDFCSLSVCCVLVFLWLSLMPGWPCLHSFPALSVLKVPFFGHSTAVTGIPEGDPLSVVGMFVFAKACDHFVQSGPASVLGATYADNWELFARSAKELARAIPVVEKFLDLCQLIVAPSTCWLPSL